MELEKVEEVFHPFGYCDFPVVEDGVAYGGEAPSAGF